MAKSTNNDLQNTHKTKDRVTRTPLSTGSELSCSTSGTRRLNLVTNYSCVLLISDSRLQPAFFAFVKQNPFTLTGINDVVKFADVTVNRGQGYNPATGVFTAPRKGLYHVSCSIMAYTNSDVNYQLNKNDAVHTYAYSSNGGYITSTINAIVEMKKGDRVFIKHRQVSKSQHICGSHHSTFSGYFMQE